MPQRHLTIWLSLCLGLSCALGRAPARDAAPSRADVALPAPMPPEQARVLEELERWQTRLSAPEREAVAATIVRESARHGLELELVLGVIRVESAFNNFAQSDQGALGLMQVMPATGALVARELGIEWRGPRTLLDPVTNVRIGTAYLAEMRQIFGSVPRALAAYNFGPGAIQRRLRRGAPVPVEYASNVMLARESLRP